jgi:phosphatidylglycerophosphate synthase
MKILEKKFRECLVKPEEKINIRIDILRNLSIPFLKMFLVIPITPNQITVFNILLTFIRFFLFASGNAFNILFGALLILFSEILDVIDGQIARYKNLCSLKGIFLDKVYHDFNYLSIYSGIGFGIYRNTLNIHYLFLGIIASIFIILTRNLFSYRKLVQFENGRKNSKISKENIFSKKGIILYFKKMVYLPRLYYTPLLIIISFFNLFFGLMHYYLIFYAIYSTLYFIPVFYYSSIFKEDKK